jgi:hypothetical protein
VDLGENKNPTSYINRNEDFNNPIKLENFEKAIKEILESKPTESKALRLDEIP